MDTTTNQLHHGQMEMGSPERMDESYNIDRNHYGNSYYPDPAEINPVELATFPKQITSETNHHHHHESHLVNKRTPIRDGRNITRTDNQPDKKGFM